jgi:hypothetical protein
MKPADRFKNLSCRSLYCRDPGGSRQRRSSDSIIGEKKGINQERIIDPIPYWAGMTLQLVRPDIRQSCILLLAVSSCASHSPVASRTTAMASPAIAGRRLPPWSGSVIPGQSKPGYCEYRIVVAGSGHDHCIKPSPVSARQDTDLQGCATPWNQ